MHELSLANGIIGIVKAEAEKSGFQRVLEISLKVGEYSGIVPRCLEEFFPIAAEGTPAQGAALRIEVLPARFRCFDCGFEGRPDRERACCPACGGEHIRMIAGREFYVENLVVE